MNYRRSNYRAQTIRTITAKFAGKCHGCGSDIRAGVLCDYHSGLKRIGHLGAFSGDGDKMGQCYSARVARQAEPFIDIDRAYEDQCADICGR